MNNTAVSLHVQILECTYVFISLGYTPRSGITESFGNFVFNFLRNCQNVFQNNRHRVDLLTSNVEVQFLYVFVDIRYFPFLHSSPPKWVWSGVSVWFWYAFPWGLVMLGIFTWAYWPFVCHLWSRVYSNPSTIFKLGYLSFYCWVVSFLYIFWILRPYLIRYMICKYILPFCALSFHSLGSVFWYTNVFYFDETQLSFLCCCCLCFTCCS